jgi:hypothetical protein
MIKNLGCNTHPFVTGAGPDTGGIGANRLPEADGIGQRCDAFGTQPKAGVVRPVAPTYSVAASMPYDGPADRAIGTPAAGANPSARGSMG